MRRLVLLSIKVYGLAELQGEPVTSPDLPSITTSKNIVGAPVGYRVAGR